MQKRIRPKEAFLQKWTIVDVRSASERSTVCVAGSLHTPLESVDSTENLRQSMRIALLCKGGTRAKMAQERLASRVFRPWSSKGASINGSAMACPSFAPFAAMKSRLHRARHRIREKLDAVLITAPQKKE